MKRTITLAAASLIAAASFATPLLAEDATKPAAGATTDTQSGTTMTPDAGATASTSADATFADVMTAIDANATSATQIGTITDVSTVKIVKVDELATGDDATELQTALTEKQADMTTLRTAIEANTALKAELDKQQVQASSVVATEIEADGAVTVYVQ